MKKRRKSYFPRYREPLNFNIGEILVNAAFVALIAYACICPLLHTFGVEAGEWSWVYWFFRLIDSVK